MKFLRCLLLILLPAAMAVGDTTDPVGALRLKLRGNSDTVVSLPLHRPALVEATLTSRTDNQLELDAAVPALPDEGAYVLVMSGALEGAVLSATSRSGNTITVSAGDYDLSSLQSGALVAVIPYWTLDTLFPAGAHVHASSDVLSVQTQILLFNDTAAGTNFSASAVYFYYTGNDSFPGGWYRLGDMSATRGNTRLVPQHYFVVRHPAGSGDTELLVTGAVQMAASRRVLSTRRSGRSQDNLVALPLPVPVTLGAAGLVDSGAFVPTTDILSVADQLLVSDNTHVGVNKSASAVYFYFAGDSSFSPGWYRFGDMTNTVDSVVLKPGEGWIVRKAATASPEKHSWSLLPSYLQ